MLDVLTKWFGSEWAAAWGPAVQAPIIEEGLKLMGVIGLALIPRVRLRSVLDGSFYGAMVALGFLVSENLVYTNLQIATSGGDVGGTIIVVFLQRGVVGALIGHMVFTAISGAGVGYFVSRSGRSVVHRTLVAAGFFLMALLAHGLNNSPLLESLGFGGMFVKAIPALTVLFLVLKWGRNEERSRMRDLAGVVDDSLVSDQDMDALSSRRSRRKARKAADDSDQERAAQDARLTLLAAADAYGSASAEASEAQDVLRTVLA